jgi:uncharacterized protein
MPVSSRDEVLKYLSKNKKLFLDEFGVRRIGVFGSFSKGSQTSSSDIDIIVDIEKNYKNIHKFFRFKRFLENELGRNIDLGFEQSLKPAVREKIKGQIVYA